MDYNKDFHERRLQIEKDLPKDIIDKINVDALYGGTFRSLYYGVNPTDIILSLLKMIEEDNKEIIRLNENRNNVIQINKGDMTDKEWSNFVNQLKKTV